MLNSTHPTRHAVTGPSYYQEVLAEIGEGLHEGVLQREPTNRYDSNAVRVMVNGSQVGYVNRRMAAGLATQMDQDMQKERPCEVMVYPPDGRRYKLYVAFWG